MPNNGLNLGAGSLFNEFLLLLYYCCFCSISSKYLICQYKKANKSFGLSRQTKCIFLSIAVLSSSLQPKSVLLLNGVFLTIIQCDANPNEIDLSLSNCLQYSQLRRRLYTRRIDNWARQAVNTYTGIDLALRIRNYYNSIFKLAKQIYMQVFVICFVISQIIIISQFIYNFCSMHIKKVRLSCFYSTKKYDLICIGPLAQKVNSLVHSLNPKLQLSCLSIRSGISKIQSALICSPIHLSSRQSSSTLLRNSLIKIQPQKSSILLKSGQEIQYNQLIYSGDEYEWKDQDLYEGFKESVSRECTGVIADNINIKNNMQKIYSTVKGNIYFSIPKRPHFAYQNLFMAHLSDSLKQISKKKNNNNPFGNQIKIKILNEGSEIFPFNSCINKSIMKTFGQNGIQVLNNVDISSVESRNRHISIKQDNINSRVPFSMLYQYLPVKTPSLLSTSQISVLSDPSTLHHQTYKNIFLIGNTLPIPYTFYAMNCMVNVIVRNVINSHLKVDKQAIYDGLAVVPFYYQKDKLKYYSMNYQGITKINEFGSNSIIGSILAKQQQTLNKFQLDSFYNGNSRGYPYYFLSPKPIYTQPQYQATIIRH